MKGTCKSCKHPAHTGTCTARSGGTAYACGCSTVTLDARLKPWRCGVAGHSEVILRETAPRCLYPVADYVCGLELQLAEPPEVAKRVDGTYTAGPPPDGRSVDAHLDELITGPSCVGCGHPVSHHRTGARNEYNAGQSRCAYRRSPSDAECPCQLHRAASEGRCYFCGYKLDQCVCTSEAAHP